jgi:hypothetical protein
MRCQWRRDISYPTPELLHGREWLVAVRFGVVEGSTGGGA